MLDIRARDRVARMLAPLLRGLDRIGLTPAALTLGGMAMAIVGGVMFALGHPVAGASWAGAGAILDVIDGPLARATGKATVKGAFLDTVADRIGEVAMWTGVILFLLPDGELAVGLAAVAFGSGLMIPFLRARAEASGVEGRGGLMGRAERNLVLLFGLGLYGLGLPLKWATLWVLAVLNSFTVLQRIYRTWMQLPE